VAVVVVVVVVVLFTDNAGGGGLLEAEEWVTFVAAPRSSSPDEADIVMVESIFPFFNPARSDRVVAESTPLGVGASASRGARGGGRGGLVVVVSPSPSPVFNTFFAATAAM